MILCEDLVFLLVLIFCLIKHLQKKKKTQLPLFCFYIASFSKTFTTHHSIHQTWPFSPPSFLLPLSKPLFPTWTVLVDFHCPVYPMYREQLSVLYTISIGILLKQSFNFVPPMSSQFTRRNGNLYDFFTEQKRREDGKKHGEEEIRGNHYIV